jgi:hypothetical protein
VHAHHHHDIGMICERLSYSSRGSFLVILDVMSASGGGGSLVVVMVCGDRCGGGNMGRQQDPLGFLFYFLYCFREC